MATPCQNFRFNCQTAMSDCPGRLAAPEGGGGAPGGAAPYVSVPRGTARALRQRARLPALHRGDFGLRDRASGTRTADSSPALSRGFRPARPVPSSPHGQPPLVGADGDPRPPECLADEAGPAGAALCSANKRHRLTPPASRVQDYIHRNTILSSGAIGTLVALGDCRTAENHS